MRTCSILALVTASACALPDPGDDGAAAPDDAVATSEAPLLVTPDNPFGNLSLVVDADGKTVTNTPGNFAWRSVPGMAATAWTRAGDNLDIGVSAAVSGSSSVWFRVVVDGVVAAPSDVLFKTGSYPAARSFRFVRSGLAAGNHVIDVQWWGDPNAKLVDHTLTVNTGAPSGKPSILMVTSPTSGASLVHTNTTYLAVPGLATSVTTTQVTDMVIAVSAESAASAGGLLLRAKLDGAVVNTVQLHGAGTLGSYGGRSAQYVVNSVPAGTHSISVEWATFSGGTAYLGDRSLSVYAAPPGGDGASLQAQQDLTVSTLGTGWLDVATVFATNRDTGGISAITATVETLGSGTVELRARVNGVVVAPSAIALQAGSLAYQTSTHTFVVKDRPFGIANVTVQARVTSGSGSIRTRTVAVLTKRRHGADFAQPLTSAITGELRPRHGLFPHLVVCFDPKHLKADGTLPPPFSLAELQAIFMGIDGRKNVSSWWFETSLGHLQQGPVTITPCYQTAHAPNYFWDAPCCDRFDEMHREALGLASADFNFPAADVNGDHVITPDELVVSVVKNQAGTGGHADKSVTIPIGGTNYKIMYQDIYMEPAGTQPGWDARIANVGLEAHELSHTLLRANELSVGAGNPVTIMWEYGYGSHIDPIHKLLSGWLAVDAIVWNDLTDRTIGLRAIEDNDEAILIYDINRPGEVIVLENRWFDDSNYDYFDLPKQPGVGGVYVWSTFFDLTNRTWFPWQALGHPYRTTLSQAGATTTVTWRDGTPAVAIDLLTSAPAQTLSVRIRKL